MRTRQENTTRAFRKGLRELRVKDVPIVKSLLMETFGVTTPQSFTRISFGRQTRLDVEMVKEVEGIFREYGVEDCWGD